MLQTRDQKVVDLMIQTPSARPSANCLLQPATKLQCGVQDVLHCHVLGSEVDTNYGKWLAWMWKLFVVRDGIMTYQRASSLRCHTAGNACLELPRRFGRGQCTPGTSCREP